MEKITIYMACGVLIIGFTYLFLVSFIPIPQTGVDHTKVIVGAMLGSVIGVIIGYFWGSSTGSADKSKTIDRALNSINPQPLVETKP